MKFAPAARAHISGRREYAQHVCAGQRNGGLGPFPSRRVVACTAFNSTGRID